MYLQKCTGEHTLVFHYHMLQCLPAQREPTFKGLLAYKACLLEVRVKQLLGRVEQLQITKSILVTLRFNASREVHSDSPWRISGSFGQYC